METIQNTRETTIKVILSGGKTRKEIEQSVDHLITNVKCNMICEELVKKLKEAKDHNKLVHRLNKL